MKIRKAKKEDLGGFIKLRKEFNDEYFFNNPDLNKLNEKNIKKEFSGFDNKKRILLVAEDKNELIGFLIGTFVSNIYKKIGYIDDIFVKKKFRKQGIGGKLIKEFEKLMNKRKVKELMLGVSVKNKKALRFYKKLGFEIKHYQMEKEL